jgi:Sec-independent protein translocase protein TatA
VSISISEIAVVLVVALVVIKPEQLPDVAFKLGKWAKQLRGTMTKLRREIDGTVNYLNEEVVEKPLPEKIEIHPHEAP